MQTSSENIKLMTAREGDMMGTQYGGRLIGTTCFTVKEGSASLRTYSYAGGFANADYIVLHIYGKSGEGSNIKILNSVVVYKEGEAYIPSATNKYNEIDISSVVRFYDGKLTFTEFNNKYLRQEIINAEMYSFT